MHHPSRCRCLERRAPQTARMKLSINDSLLVKSFHSILSLGAIIKEGTACEESVPFIRPATKRYGWVSVSECFTGSPLRVDQQVIQFVRL
jgi:hypothetical protein